LAALSLLVVACGSQGASGQKPHALVVAALGDSITAGSPLWDPDPAVRGQVGNPIERSQYEYWASRADPKLEFRNCGVFGERTDQIAARLTDCADGADVLIVQGGINDIAQAFGGGRRAMGNAIDAAAQSIDGMVVSGQKLGLEVLLVDVLPWNNGYPDAREPIIDLNREIEHIGRERDVPVLPFHDTLEDPNRPEQMRPDLTIDGDHPSIDGYRRLGELVAERLG
jgi:lysophospholipase L1-like esterase